jgi:hypothetical protein
MRKPIAAFVGLTKGEAATGPGAEEGFAIAKAARRRREHRADDNFAKRTLRI